MKSIEIMDRLTLALLLSSRIDPREPIYKQFDKLPKDLVEDLKLIKSDELSKIRPDAVM